MEFPSSAFPFSGSRLEVHYRIVARDETHARERAYDICLEQTVEIPGDIVPTGPIRDHVVGRIEGLEQAGDGRYLARISYALEVVAPDLMQLLNTVYGNISIKLGIRLEHIEAPPELLASFEGPRFGIAGLRERTGVHRAPLLCSALKPMGMPLEGLAQMAHEMALGGIDLIKDDHGIGNQPFSTFQERVERCVEAVERANHLSGQRSVYVPHVTADGMDTMERARIARRLGAGAVMVTPGLCGLTTMRGVASDPEVRLPILSHPAFSGGQVVSPDHGLKHGVLFGTLQRLAGADASIFPNFGGRFSFSREECMDIARGCTHPMANVRSIFPTPGGGMSFDGLPGYREVFGDDVIYLVGGSLLRRADDLPGACREFRRLVGRD